MVDRNIVVEDENTKVEVHNGTTFIARYVPGIPKFTIAALINAGSLDDTAGGTAHYFEHIPFGGTQNFGPEEVLHYMQERGGEARAYTVFDRTVYTGTVTKGNESDAIFAISDLVTRPKFDVQAILTERETILDEWAWGEMHHDRSQFWKISYHIHDGKLQPVIGTVSDINNVTIEHIKEFYQTHYRSDGLIVALEGDCDIDAVLEEAKRQFILPSGEPKPVICDVSFDSKTVRLETQQAATKAIIIFPVPGENATIHERAVQDLLWDMLKNLNGPLFKELRFQNRLTYDVDVQLAWGRNWGFRQLELVGFTPKIKPLIEHTAKTIGEFISNPDESLFETLKKNKIQEIETVIQRQPEMTAHDIVVFAYTHNTALSRLGYLNAVKTVTMSDIRSAAKRYLASDDKALFYIGKQQDDFPNHTDFNAIVQAYASSPPAAGITGPALTIKGPTDPK